MAEKGDYENPVENMVHEIEHIEGFRSYIILNSEMGIVLKYTGMEVSRGM